jgi:PAS domain S-box-containing protein
VILHFWLPLAALAALVLPHSIAAAPKKEIRRILILNEVGTSYPATKIINEGIQIGLQNSADNLEFYSEYLDTVLFPDPAEQQDLRDFYLHKYQNRRPDVIITVGPSPLKFMLEVHQKAFPGVPIVFCLPHGDAPATPALDSNFTGVEDDMAPAETLEIALRLQPGTKHVVVVSGVSDFDKQGQVSVMQHLKAFTNRLDIRYLTDLAMPDLLERLRQLPNHTVVLLVSVGQDAAGTRFKSNEVGSMVADATNAPVFSLFDVFLNHGEVGGYLSSLGEQGKVAGAMALRLLSGAKPQDIPRVEGVNTYMFDWRALQHWGLKESALPPGSIVLNKPLSVWEVYKRSIIAGIFLLLLQAVIIAGLLWQRAKRRKSEQDLIWRLQFESLVSHFSSTFINLREEEVNVNIRQNMAHLGNFLDLDRISLFEFSPDGQQMEAIFSWSRTGVGAPPRIVGTGDLLWWRSKLLRGEVSLATDLNDMPEEALAEKEYFRQLGILSAASIPLKMAGEVNGAISFVSTRRRISWKPDVVSQLQVVGEILWSALQRKRAVAILRESEERFRLVANTAPVLIWMSGPDKLCNYCNQPWLDFSGRTLEAELGNGWLEGVHPEDLKNCLDGYTRAFDLRESFKMQYRMRRHDGEYRWLLDIGVPRLNPDGLFVGYIGSCLDVTDGKLAEEALSEVGRRLIEAHEEERTWLARELHDDINQRIALLVIQLERWAQHPPSSGDDVTDHIRPVLEQLSDLGKDIQALSHRLHSSKLEYLGIAVAANGFCKELSEQQKVEIDFSHAEVPRGLPKEISLCLFRVLQEALQNAVKHSGERHFSVELHGTSQEIQLTVSDSGVGFDQQDAITRRGLGLISMRERMQLVGGEFSIKSKRGTGTTIRARVPFIAEEHRATATG